MIIPLLFIIALLQSTGGGTNVLLIIVDDLRNSLGCYGDPYAYTPNINIFAKESVIFTQAYAQQALCAPSRNSFLTGRRPDTLQLYDFYSYWRDAVGNFSTLPQYLKESGYTTMSIGKVFHPGKSSNGSDDSPYSWSEKPFHPYTDRYKDAAVCGNTSFLQKNLVCPVNVTLMPNRTLPDIETLHAAKRFLREHGKRSKPFFLAVGFQKPHIPFKYPDKYLKHHPLYKFNVPIPYAWPANVSSVAYNPWTDLRKRDDVKTLSLKFPWEKIPESFAKLIIQSYYAAVSYVDDMIGKLLNELHYLKIQRNTVIILTSDHGWSLGEHAEWAKYSNFDVAVRVPLIISIPNLTFDDNKPVKSDGCRQTNAMVELVDIFSTIADLAGKPIPMCPDISGRIHLRNAYEENGVLFGLPNPCSEGISLVPLIKATRKCKIISWKKAAFSQYPRPGIKPSFLPNSDEPRLKEINIMGYSLKTRRYRYTAWISYEHKTKKANWSNIIAEELYDHKFDIGEKFNMAMSLQIIKIKRALREMLEQGWRSALP